MTRNPDLLGLACYHSHQAAEKALKAFLISHGRGLLRVHDVEYLILLCTREDRFFRALLPDGLYLNPFYIEMNYPVMDALKIPRRIPQRAIRSAQKIAKFVEARLPA